jgi:tripeptide aminopeptidase
MSPAFLRHVVTTPSDPACDRLEAKNLGRLLASELLAIGLTDAHLDEHGYVYATIPANGTRRCR